MDPFQIVFNDSTGDYQIVSGAVRVVLGDADTTRMFLTYMRNNMVLDYFGNLANQAVAKGMNYDEAFNTIAVRGHDVFGQLQMTRSFECTGELRYTAPETKTLADAMADREIVGVDGVAGAGECIQDVLAEVALAL